MPTPSVPYDGENTPRPPKEESVMFTPSATYWLSSADPPEMDGLALPPPGSRWRPGPGRRGCRPTAARQVLVELSVEIGADRGAGRIDRRRSSSDFDHLSDAASLERQFQR